MRFEVAAARLTHFVNRGALRSASETAYLGGQAAGLRVGPFGGVRGLSKLVRVQFAEPVRAMTWSRCRCGGRRRGRPVAVTGYWTRT